MPTRITHYQVGDVWQPQATFTVGGTPTDPTALTVKQQAPTGTETVLANAVNPATLNPSSTPVAKTSTGVFKLNPGITLNAAGYWFVRFEGTGTAAAAQDHQAIADPSEFASDGGLSATALVGLAETKDWLQQQNIDVTQDLDLVRVINDVSDRFQQEAEREIKPPVPTATTRLFAVGARGYSDPFYIDGDYRGERSPYARSIDVGDLASLTSVQIIDTDWVTVLESVSLANVAAQPLNRKPWEPINRLEFNTNVTSLRVGMRVSVTGVWGFPLVPGDVRQAVLDAVAATMDRDVEHYSSDLAPVQSDSGATVIQIGMRPRLLSMPASTLAVAWRLRDSYIA